MGVLVWIVVVLLLGAAVAGVSRWSRQHRDAALGSSSLWRGNAGLWLCGALFGIAVSLPAYFRLISNTGGPAWWAALLLGILALPIHAAVDLTFPLWGYLGSLGP